MRFDAKKIPRHPRWPNIVVAILSVAVLLFLAAVAWIAMAWVPLTAAVGVVVFYLMLALPILALIWLVLNVIAAR
jgi:hypothetical protein